MTMKMLDFLDFLFGPEALPVGDPPRVDQPTIQAIVDKMNGCGHAPPTGDTGARIAWVLVEILKAFRALPLRAATAAERAA